MFLHLPIDYLRETSTVSSVKSRVTFMSVGFHGNTCSCGIGYLFSLDTALVGVPEKPHELTG